MTGLPLRFCRARLCDPHSSAVTSLIEDATAWLRLDKASNQWDEPWPSQAEHDERFRRHLRQGRTWIAWDGEMAVATITADPARDPRWQDGYQQPAVYVQRFVVARSVAGLGLGADLLDWAGRSGQRDHGAAWIRVNCWTANKELHDYYLTLGFESCGLSDDDGCPSRARFQRPAGQAMRNGSRLFVEVPDSGQPY